MIMGYDSVYLGYDVQFALMDSIKFEEQMTKGEETIQEVTCMITSANSIAQALSLNVK